MTIDVYFKFLLYSNNMIEGYITDYDENSAIKNIIYDIYPAYEGGDTYTKGYTDLKKILSETNVQNIFKFVDNGPKILQSYIDILDKNNTNQKTNNLLSFNYIFDTKEKLALYEKK